MSPSTVASVVADARAHGLDASVIDALTDAEFEERVSPKSPKSCMRPEPDCAALYVEL